MDITHSLDLIEKKLDKNDVLIGIDVVISISGGTSRIPFKNTFPPESLDKLDEAIKNWAVSCTQIYEANFSKQDDIKTEAVDVSSVPFDSASILEKSREKI